MGRELKGQQGAAKRVPDPPPTTVDAFAGGFDVGVVDGGPLGPLQEAHFGVPGGTITVRWPLAFGPKIAHAIAESHDEAKAKLNGIATPERGIWTPGAG